MSITLDLSANLETRVKQEAAKRGQSVQEYRLQLVTTAIPDCLDEKRITQSQELLASVWEIGDAEEQQETFAFLREAIDEDRLSDRKRFS